jgi:hypothetical protein
LSVVRSYMKRWQWVLLITELALFAIILILPQVDLPDFTFHGGTAPVATKSRILSSPVRLTIAIMTADARPSRLVQPHFEVPDFTASASTHSRLSLFCVLIC